MKYLIFLLSIFMITSVFAVNDLGLSDPTKPKLESPEATSITIEINETLLNVNNSDLLDGTDWDEHINGTANQLCYFDGENSVKGIEDTSYSFGNVFIGKPLIGNKGIRVQDNDNNVWIEHIIDTDGWASYYFYNITPKGSSQITDLNINNINVNVNQNISSQNIQLRDAALVGNYTFSKDGATVYSPAEDSQFNIFKYIETPFGISRTLVIGEGANMYLLNLTSERGININPGLNRYTNVYGYMNVSNNISAQCYTFADGTTQCTASTGGSMNYTNLAKTNETNNFTQKQIFSNDVDLNGYTTINQKALLYIAQGCGCGSQMDSIAIIQNGSFANWNWTYHYLNPEETVYFNTLIDAGNNWNWSANGGRGAYRVPINGTYEIITKMRGTDGSGAGATKFSYGYGGGCISTTGSCDSGTLFTANTNYGYSEMDGPFFFWGYRTGESRGPAIPNVRLQHFVEGDLISFWTYIDASKGDEGVSDLSMSIKLLSAD